MNVGGVIEVVSPGASKLPLGSGAGLTALGKGQGLGSFLSLLGDLIEVPSLLPEGQPSLGSNTGNPNSKKAPIGEKIGNDGKKTQENAKPAVIQTLPEPAPVIIKPPLTLTAPSIQSANAAHSEAEADSEAQSGGEIFLAAGTKSPVEAPSQLAIAPASKPEIAFGLRLASANPPSKPQAAVYNSPAPKESDPKLTGSAPASSPAKDLGVPHLPQSTPQYTEPSEPTVNDASMLASAPRTSVAAPVVSAASVAAPAPGRQEPPNTLSEFGSPPPVEAPKTTASAIIPQASGNLTAANPDNKITPNNLSGSEIANQSVETEETLTPQPAIPDISVPDSRSDREAPSVGSTDIEPLPDVQRDTTSDLASRGVASRNVVTGTSNQHQETSPSRAPGTPREVSPQNPQRDSSQEEANPAPQMPKATLGETGPKRSMLAASNSEGEQTPSPFESNIPITSASRTPDGQSEPSQASDAPSATKVETGPEINAASQAQPARQISLKLTGPDSAKVDVELSEKGGKVQVAVRTADRELAKSLQGDLGDLVGRLETKGFKTEAWIPGAAHMGHTAAAAEPSSAGQGSREHSGSSPDQQSGRQGRNGSNQRQQARWMAQLQESISTDETRSEDE